jgi:3-methylfumaryl-CoA hydratase
MREAVDAPARRAEGRAPANGAPGDGGRTVLPDETLLFRYSAITFNPHRIHYDIPTPLRRRAIPALVVNGGIASYSARALQERAGASRDRSPRATSRRCFAADRCI